MLSYKEFLEEKLIQFNNNKKYGQVVFLAGGGGSGKGFALKNFLPSSDFKVLDVDEYKRLFLKIAELKNKYPEIKGMDLRNPKDVFKLHDFVKKLGIKDKIIDNFLISSSKGNLPNIIFDITLKEISDVEDITPKLLEYGYQKKDIHIVWILQKYTIAVQDNSKRERVVPEDILLKTHEGAAVSMDKIINGKLPFGVDGKIAVILNKKENTIVYKDNPSVIKDFKYIVVKKEGNLYHLI